jgi:hypothetical protein
MNLVQQRLTRGAVLVLLVIAGGCAAAAGAAAGAAAVIAYNERNASANVDASVAELASATTSVFSEMGIAENDRRTSEGGTEVDVFGVSDDGDVTVHIERDGGATTRVVVTVREGDVDYKPTIAGRILQRIIDRTT